MTRLKDTQSGFLKDLNSGLGVFMPQPPNGDSDSESGWNLSNWLPTVDIFDNHNDDLVFEIETPGFDRNDLDISVRDNKVIIRGERKRKTTERTDERDYLRTERQFGSFRRVFSLPNEVNPDDIQAAYEDGILTLSVPSLESSERKAIEID